jgi:RND family efflux transporter MFP subunit
MQPTRTLPVIAALISGLSASVGARQTSPAPDITTFTSLMAAPARASRDATLSFTFPAEVAKVLVKGGQRVKQGQPLVIGRDDDVRAQRDLQKSQADSDLDIQKAQTGVDQAQVEFDSWQKMDRKIAGNQLEYDRARTTLAARKVELDIAKLQKGQASIQLALRQAQLDRYTLNAPFDGIIDNVVVEVGEVKKDTEPVLKIVATDPLWIDVAAGTDQTITLGLKAGDKAWVVLGLPGEPAVHEGKIVEIGAEADFAAKTRRVRVELANAEGWPAGLGAWVRFTPPEGEWAKRMAPSKKAERSFPMLDPNRVAPQNLLADAGAATEQTKK